MKLEKLILSLMLVLQALWYVRCTLKYILLESGSLLGLKRGYTKGKCDGETLSVLSG